MAERWLHAGLLVADQTGHVHVPSRSIRFTCLWIKFTRLYCFLRRHDGWFDSVLVWNLLVPQILSSNCLNFLTGAVFKHWIIIWRHSSPKERFWREVDNCLSAQVKRFNPKRIAIWDLSRSVKVTCSSTFCQCVASFTHCVTSSKVVFWVACSAKKNKKKQTNRQKTGRSRKDRPTSTSTSARDAEYKICPRSRKLTLLFSDVLISTDSVQNECLSWQTTLLFGDSPSFKNLLSKLCSQTEYLEVSADNLCAASWSMLYLEFAWKSKGNLI